MPAEVPPDPRRDGAPLARLWVVDAGQTIEGPLGCMLLADPHDEQGVE